MNCPTCKAKLLCYDSRPHGDDMHQRKYRCPDCSRVYTTREEFKPWIGKRCPSNVRQERSAAQ